MHSILARVREEALPIARQGKTADYIPALSSADPAALGLALFDAQGAMHSCGEAERRFSIQSISKVLALAYVMSELGEAAVFSRVGKEPSGDPFNSIIRLETSAKRRPFNPFINAGAIVVSSLMPGADASERNEGFIAFVRRLAHNPGLAMDEAVFLSERESAARNRSIAWFLKELKLIEGEVDDCLDGYFMQCALSMNAVELSRIGAALAMDGIDPSTGQRALSARASRVIKSLMVTCGMYDGSGEFAVDVGIPAKSGVGGGILAAVRDRYGIGVYGPALDERGNSIAGIEALKRLSGALDLRVL
ncbi:MAG TPA: glutaminase A [Spirochaetaceae bacterium]|jgi:glutaminase|nr:glutaminase A [Spirochaetaceae bacterium]